MNKPTFAPPLPNEAWVTNITYVHIGEEWFHVAEIRDVFTCELVDCAMGEAVWKDELVHHYRYAARADALAAIQEYIESPITTSDAMRALAMFRSRCLLKNSAHSHRRLETIFPAVDSTPQCSFKSTAEHLLHALLRDLSMKSRNLFLTKPHEA